MWEENVTSILSVDEYTKQETSMTLVADIMFVLFFDPEDEGDMFL
jgi:hypothetical protein